MGISPQIQIGILGWEDSLLLMVLALVVLGPRRLPQVGRQIGKLMYEFRKASNDFKFQMEEELRNAEDADRRKREETERQRSLADAQRAAELAQSAAETALNAAAEIKSAQAAQQVSSTEASANEAPTATEMPTEAAPAEGALRVQPPSTGEQVAASRPGQALALGDEPASDESSDTAMKIEPASEERPATESTAHHG